LTLVGIRLKSIVMKKTLMITVLLTLTIFAGSQTLVQDNKSWNVVECMNSSGCSTHSFKIIGDTSFGQVDYKKLYSTYDTTLTNWNIYGAMRENENQVFLYNFSTETEELLYDFNLSVGDTFSTIVNTPDYFGCPIELVVSSIDTVSLENNEHRQRIMFGGEQWISGIGSLNGLIYVGIDQCIFDMYYELSCYHENNELIYQSPNIDGCFVVTVGLEENSAQIKHSVYPNPFSQSTKLKFDYSSSQNYRLQIINSMGQIIQMIKKIDFGEIIIKRNQLNTGIYFYRLINENKEIASGKFIVK